MYYNPLSLSPFLSILSVHLRLVTPSSQSKIRVFPDPTLGKS